MSKDGSIGDEFPHGDMYCMNMMPIEDKFAYAELVREEEPQPVTEITIDPGKFEASTKNIYLSDKALRKSVPLSESRKMERGDLLNLLEDSIAFVLDGDSRNLPENLATLRKLAQGTGGEENSEARATIDEKLRDDFDRVVAFVAERVYWKTLLAKKDDYTLLSKTSAEINKDIQEIKIRDGGLPSEIGQKFIYYELKAGKLEDKFTIWGIPSNYDFRFGVDTRLIIITQDQYQQTNGQDSVFDRTLVPTIITRVLGPAVVATTSLFCVLPGNLPTNTPTPSPEIAPTPQPTSTETQVPIPNAVEEQINSEVKMTLEKWKKVFSGSYVSERGDVYPDLGVIFSSEESEVLTDPEKIRALPPGTEMAVLNINPVFTVWMEKEEAALRAEQGATILVAPPGSKTDGLAQFALIAAKKLAKDNDKQNDIRVEFGESKSDGLPWGIYMQFGDGPGGRTIPIEMTSDGRYISPLLSRPLHFIVVDPVTNEEVPDIEGLDDPVYWVDSIAKAGLNISIRSDEFSMFFN